MLIMAYAHARASGDGSVIKKYVSTPLFLLTFLGSSSHAQYNLFKTYADYLVNNTLNTQNQCVAVRTG